MASSGTQTVWGGPSGKFYVRTDWTLNSQSIENNRSSVNVKMYIGAASGWSASISTNSFSVAMTGQTTATGSNRSINISGNRQLLIDQNFLVNHNADGTRTVNISSYFTGSYIGTINPPQFAAALDSIPRASTLASPASANLTAGSSKTISINRASSSFYHGLDIYLTRGSTELLLRSESYNLSTTSKTLTWSNDELDKFWQNGHNYWTGTKMVLRTITGGNEVGRTTTTGSLSYPSDNSVGSFSGNLVLGQNVSVNISKASSLYSHEIQLRLPSGTNVGSNGLSTASSFTIVPNQTAIQNATTTTTSINIELWIRTVLTANTSRVINTWTREATRVMTIPESPPTMGTMSYTEINTTVAGIMGTTGITNPTLVQLNSHPRFSFTAASAQLGASITSYTVSIGGQNLSRTTAGTLDFIPANMTISTPLNIGAATQATLTATDSRGFTNSISIPVAYVAYSPPVLSATATRVNGFSDTVRLTASATISSVDGKNSVATTNGFTTRQRTMPSGTFPTGFTNRASTTVSGRPTMTAVSLTLSNTNSYEFEFRVTDRFGTSTVLRVAGAGKPIMFVDSKKLSVGVNMFPTISNGFQVGGPTQLIGNTTITGTLGVSSHTTLSGNLSVAGTSTFTGNTTINAISPAGGKLDIISVSDEMVRLTAPSGTYGYMSIYDGGTRVGYMGSTTNGTRIMRLHADAGPLILRGSNQVETIVGSSTIMTVTSGSTTLATDLNVTGNVNPTKGVSFAGGYENVDGNVYYNGSRLRVRVGGTFRDIAHSGDPFDNGSGSIEGSLIHNSGYMHIKVFNTTSSHYSSVSTSTSRAEMYYSGASNNRVIFIARTNGGSTTTTSVQASSFPTSSSIKYKEAIEEYTGDALQKIMETKVKTYNLKGHAKANRKVGVIIEEGVPDEIVEITGDAIDPYSMVSMSWKAIQQLGHELFVKDQEIEALHEKNQELEKRLERIEQLLGGGGQ